MSGMFTRFVEPGRLALITYGPCEGKMCTIVDIVDQKRVVVDGPVSVTGVPRHMMPIKRLSFTDFRAKIVRGAREKALKIALDTDDIMSKWADTVRAKQIKARETRKNMTDFERFKLMVAKRKRAAQVRAAVRKSKKETRLQGHLGETFTVAAQQLSPSLLTMSGMFTRFVEPGRLALITYGPCEGKMCTIIDIVDQKRVVVDGPVSVTGVPRHMMPIKRLSLTDFKAKIVRGAREKALKIALDKNDIMSKWTETTRAKQIKARETRKNM
eukprot:CAMPEP_0172928698 /NCGR_PEP_ID=MMETSP1075-20121228/218110_1 /TAXON_ID=2916 /ORGANISM="Ceratium fusus, Strain PA161109" /LENGTH=269 /DNA_ID=CAMNT_0013789985 /DNA_START=93 /DNA_END=900 /DNA_ORIENTATION=+